MAEATEQELRNMLSGLTGVSSDTISLYLADAKAKVIGHGFTVAHSRFSELQRMMAANLLSIEGKAGKTIVSESVADVNIGFADNSGGLGTLYATNWEREYQKTKTSILGLADRCL